MSHKVSLFTGLATALMAIAPAQATRREIAKTFGFEPLFLKAVGLRDAGTREINPADGPPMAPGDRLERNQIWGGRIGGSPFFVDNVRIVDYGREDIVSLVEGLDVDVGADDVM